MDTFSSFFDYQPGSRAWSYDSLKNLRGVQNHLKRVYLTLCCALVASAFGGYPHVLWNIGVILIMIRCIGTMIWLRLSPPCEQQTRLSLLFVSAVLEGASIAPLIKVDTSILLITAFVGTAIAFLCFSVAAILTRRREYLYLGGLLSSGLSMLIWLQFASSIFGGGCVC